MSVGKETHKKMKKLTLKSAAILVVMLGVMVVSAAPSAFAQGRRARCATNGGYSTSTYDNVATYDNRSYINDRYDSQYDSRYDSRYERYDDYWNRENTAGKTVKRVGIGAGIGAGAGALLGGKKGDLIGAGIGAAGGYIYHRKKVSDSRRWW